MDLGDRHPRGRGLGLGASLIAVAAVAGLAGPADAGSSGCTPAGSTTVAAGKAARIFRSHGGAFYGCLRSRGVPVFLATKTLPLRTAHVAGPFAAFSRPPHHDGQTDEDMPATVSSIGLCRSDARRFKYNVGAGDAVTDLVVSRHGDIAWIARVGGIYRVVKLDTSASRRPGSVLDRSATIAPRSLTLKSGRVSWRDASVRHSARLRTTVSTCRP